MKTWMLKNLNYVNWDRFGMGLSFVCALHCLLTPVLILSLPLMARYYLAHPGLHILLALFVLPVGLLAFVSGIRHHRNYWVLAMGLPGLFLVVGTPFLVHRLNFSWNEPVLMILGSGLLMTAHWVNRRSCSHCATDSHSHSQH
ncbi:MAG: MerC domain-containing protein [Pseudobdellovibrionaceae bacterium]